MHDFKNDQYYRHKAREIGLIARRINWTGGTGRRRPLRANKYYLLRREGSNLVLVSKGLSFRQAFMNLGRTQPDWLRPIRDKIAEALKEGYEA